MLVLTPRPAAAHFCSIPVEVNLGERVNVNIGVAAEEKPVRAVDIEIPDGFDLDEPFGFMGYEPTRRGKWVHFEGAEIQRGACHYFAFQGEATKKGRLVARIITTAPDGTKTRYEDLRPGALFPAMLIFAGVDMADYSDDDGGVPTWVGVVISLALGVVAVAVAMWVRRRVTMGR